jgi:carboxypeptidase Taq
LGGPWLRSTDVVATASGSWETEHEGDESVEHVERLKARLTEVHNLQRVEGLLHWDQATYMPRGGARARSAHCATLRALAHRLLVDEETAHLLDAATDEVRRAGLDAESDEASLIRVARRDYTQATALPESFVQEKARTTALARAAWEAARSADDFAAFAPWIEQTFDLARREAEYRGYAEHPYDALLDQYEPGMTVAQVRPLFARLREGLVPLVAAVAAHADAVDDAVLHRHYERAAQLRVAEDVVRRFGYDFERGRLDLTAHPFALSFSRDDVRITTRVDETFLSMCLLGTMHEAGHGMYEQNIARDLDGTYLGRYVSLGIHESQSRLWENVVGRSRGFWQYAFPLLREVFPAVLADADAETLYRAVNKVAPSTIRVEADEVTYNLHIMLRFELEMELLEGRLTTRELPERWNALMQQYLGITPPSHAEGVLQDVHWSLGLIGYFPTYTLGNVLSVQLYEAAVRAEPGIPDAIARGEFAPLLAWMREHVHRYGRTIEPDDLVRRATASALDPEPYLRYLHDKFAPLYNVRIA